MFIVFLQPIEEAARSLFSALPLPMAIIRIYLCCPSQWPPIKFDCQTFADISTWTASSNPIFVRFCVSAAGDFTLLVSVAFHVFAFAVKLQIAPAIVSASPALASDPFSFPFV